MLDGDGELIKCSYTGGQCRGERFLNTSRTWEGILVVTRAKYCISLRRPFHGMVPPAPMPMLRVAATTSVSSRGCIVMNCTGFPVFRSSCMCKETRRLSRCDFARDKVGRVKCRR